MKEKLLTTKNVVLMGMFGALAGVLMLFEFPLPFLAPSFYGLDVSEVPVLIGTFAMGPVAGAIMEVVKILVKLVLKPTSTGFVGEFANLVISCAMVVPAGFPYPQRRYDGSGCGNRSDGSSWRGSQCPGDASVLLQLYADGDHSGSRCCYQSGSGKRMDLRILLRRTVQSGKGYCGICGYLSGLQARQRSDPQCGKSSESGKEQQTCQRIEHPLLQLI